MSPLAAPNETGSTVLPITDLMLFYSASMCYSSGKETRDLVAADNRQKIKLHEVDWQAA